jgi:hypothetical protein
MLLDRRELIVAVINCEAEGVSGSADNVPVIEWIKVFMTEPVGIPGVFDIFVEVIRALEPGVDEILHDEIVLYR